jgi:hypothetical protein
MMVSPRIKAVGSNDGAAWQVNHRKQRQLGGLFPA